MNSRAITHIAPNELSHGAAGTSQHSDSGVEMKFQYGAGTSAGCTGQAGCGCCNGQFAPGFKRP